MSDAAAAPQGEYNETLISLLQVIWGEGFLSPGGEAHLDAIVAGLDLRDKLVLDIGCAIGGFDFVLARKYGARVVGLDVERPLIELGRRRTSAAGLDDCVDLRLYQPGPLPFPDARFDVVFGKDSWAHIEDKRSFLAEVFRVLKPGGVLAAGDWMRSERPYDEDMEYFFEMEGLTYHMDTLETYRRLLHEAGFTDIHLEDICDEYRRMCHQEYEKLRTSLARTIRDAIGAERHAHFVENWRAMSVVLDKGDLRPGRMRATRPR